MSLIIGSLVFLVLAPVIIIIIFFFKGAEVPEKNYKEISKVVPYIMFALTAGAVLVSVLGYKNSIKQPIFNIEIVNDQGNYEETMGGNLFLERYENNSVNYGFSVPTRWTIKINNNGERTARNVSFRMIFDNVSFLPDGINDYKLTFHQRGIGGWQGLILNYQFDLLPDDHYVIPYLPFEGQAFINNAIENPEDVTSLSIVVQIFADDIKSFEKKIKVEIRDPEYGEYYNSY